MLNLLIFVSLLFSLHPGGGMPEPLNSRYIVPFQYGWRFHYGDDPSSPPLSGPGHCSTAFEKNLQDESISKYH